MSLLWKILHLFLLRAYQPWLNSESLTWLGLVSFWMRDYQKKPRLQNKTRKLTKISQKTVMGNLFSIIDKKKYTVIFIAFGKEEFLVPFHLVCCICCLLLYFFFKFLSLIITSYPDFLETGQHRSLINYSSCFKPKLVRLLIKAALSLQRILVDHFHYPFQFQDFLLLLQSGKFRVGHHRSWWTRFQSFPNCWTTFSLLIQLDWSLAK